MCSSDLIAALVVACFVTSGPLATAAEGTDPDGGRIHLTWNAPHGQPRATESLIAACGDSMRVDTLWLTFEPGKDSQGFLGMTGEVTLWPAPGDTLDPHWNFGEGQKVRRLRVEFNPDSTRGLERAWRDGGIGRFGYFYSGRSGTIRMIQAVGSSDALPVRAGVSYPLARALVPRPASAEVCKRPICFEWQWATMGYGYGDEPQVRRGSRYVSWNPQTGRDACATMRQVGAPRAWRPGSAPRDTTKR